MKRRSFLAGLLSTTAAVVLPHPNVPRGGEVNEAVATELKSFVSRPIGIALQSGKAGDFVDIALSNFGNAVRYAHLDRDVFAGDVLMDSDTSFYFDGTQQANQIEMVTWRDKTQEEILEDIETFTEDARMSDILPNVLIRTK